MAFQKRFELSMEPQVLRFGEQKEISFDTNDLPGFLEGKKRIKLRLRGDVDLHPSWMYEGGLPYYYRDIDDALTTDTHHSAYALDIRAAGEPWPRRAHYKIQCPPKINSQYPVPQGGGAWQFSLWVRTEDLTLGEEGKACVQFLHYLKKEGRNIRDINDAPDETLILDLPTGTTEWQMLTMDIPLDDDSAAMLVSIRLEGAEGRLLLEDLRLENSLTFNILPPIAPANRYHECFNWYGENLSHKEWTDLAVTVNGKPMAQQSLFQRCFRGSENEFELPLDAVIPGKNTIQLTNVSDYREPLPFNLNKAELLAEEIAPVRIAWCPETARAGETFGILLKTYTENVHVAVQTSEGLQAPASILCDEPGLHVLKVSAGVPSGPQTVTVTAGEHTETVTLSRVVQREEDGVLVGSGDAIYISQELDQMEDFLIWYLENGLGNMLTFRPVYRWSGTRECNGPMWRKLTSLLNDLGIMYCHMFDGRELPGLNANPTKEMLAGECFLGSQAHERDGALYYWLQRKHPTNDVLYEELSHKILRHPDYPDYHLPLTYDGSDTWFCFSPKAPKDMKEAAEQFVTKARAALGGMKRHTGPATVFKYFFQAGLAVGGAELMYGPLEVVLSALRGASAAYHRDVFTSHLAVQWGTTPHDTLERYRRYQLALYVSYLQGVSHINTEEGLYRQEEFFAVLDRFSEPLAHHQKVERDFVSFVNTHTRRGQRHRGVALLHGACDGWATFCRRNPWAQEGKQWEFAAPEESWDLIQVFYPDNKLDAIYCHPCPAEPQGYYTRTPYGTVDILPVEAENDVLDSYSAMAFLGWNTADETQLRKLKDYVRQGGTLVLGWPHLFTDTRREEVFAGNVHPLDASDLTGVKLRYFAETDERPTMGRVELAESTEVLEEHNGLPLLICNRLGKGTVYFVNAREYPAEEPVRSVYENLLHQLGQEERLREKEKGFLESEGTVQTGTYDSPDGMRTIYAVNTDWWSQEAPETKAVLHLAGMSYPVEISRGRIYIFTIRDGAAALVSDMKTEVLALDKGRLTVQGVPGGTVTVFGRGEYTLTQSGITEIEF